MTKIAIAVLVALHLAVAVWHGNAHTALTIALPPEKSAFVVSSDNIGHLPHGSADAQSTFIASAAALALLELASALCGAFYLGRLLRASATGTR